MKGFMKEGFESSEFVSKKSLKHRKPRRLGKEEAIYGIFKGSDPESSESEDNPFKKSRDIQFEEEKDVLGEKEREVEKQLRDIKDYNFGKIAKGTKVTGFKGGTTLDLGQGQSKGDSSSYTSYSGQSESDSLHSPMHSDDQIDKSTKYDFTNLPIKHSPKMFPPKFGALGNQEKFGKKEKGKKINKEEAKFREDYGKGFSILKKLGGSAMKGMGKESQGILEPIIAERRPDRLGLGNIHEYTEKQKDQAKQISSSYDEEEKERKRSNWKKGKKRKRDNHESKEEVISKDLDKVGGGIPLGEERIIDAALHRKPRYLSVGQIKKDYSKLEKELTFMGGSGRVQNTKIIDMTGPTREITKDYSQINNTSFDLTSAPKLTKFTNLLKRLKFYRSQHQNICANCARQVEHSKDSIVNILHENEQNQILCTQAAQNLEHLHLFRECLTTIHNEIPNLTEENAIEWINQYSTLAEQYDKLFKEHKILDYMATQLRNLLKPKLAKWNIQENAGMHIDTISSFLLLIQNQLRDTPSNIDFTHSKESTNNTGEKSKWELFSTAFLKEIWLNPIRSYISNGWDPRNAEECIDLLTIWDPIITKVIRQSIFEQLILPKLEKTIKYWDFKTETIMPHLFLFQWLPIVGERLRSIFEYIPQKIQIILQEWDASDPSAKSILEPWADVLEPSIWNGLMTRSIIPKLKYKLLKAKHNPADQREATLALTSSLAWLKYIGDSTILGLIDQCFFPSWLKVLKEWMSMQSVDYNQVIQWYQGWKLIFQNEGIIDHELIQRNFIASLYIIRDIHRKKDNKKKNTESYYFR